MQKIKADIRKGLGEKLTCSAGIAPNKLLAKLASDMKKSDGLVIIRQEDIGRMLECLPVKELCGIGSRIEAHLRDMGIKTCGKLGRASAHALKNRYGDFHITWGTLIGRDENPSHPFFPAKIDGH